MLNIAIAAVKVVAYVLLTLVLAFAILIAAGLGAAQWVLAHCTETPGAPCALADWVASWWWIVFLALSAPIFVLSCVTFVRKWASPGTRINVVGGVGVIWGGAILLQSLLFQTGLSSVNVIACIVFFAGLYLFFRKPRRA